MPTVTYNQADPWEAGPLALGAWLQGKAKATVFNEQKHQFDEQLALQHDQLSEQKREWTGDDEFKLAELNNANAQQKLNRQQQMWLEQYASRRQEYLQNNQNRFEGAQNDANRAAADLANRRQVAAEIHGHNTQRYIADEDRKQREQTIELNRQQMNDQARVFDVAETVLQGRDPSTLTPQEREGAIQAVTDQLVGVERVRGDARDINPASPAEIARYRQQAESVINNYKDSKAKYVKNKLDEELAVARARQGQASRQVTYDGQMRFVETPDPAGTLHGWDDGSLKAWGTATNGILPIDASNMSPTDHAVVTQAEQLILDANAKVTKEPGSAHAMAAAYDIQLQELMKDLPDQYQAYYRKALYNATIDWAESITSQAGALPPPVPED
jgi:hypothetical protein